MIARGDRQRRILDAAATLFGERSPETVTMDEVARRAGVAKGTLYRYFPSKDDMVRALLGSRLDELVDGLEREAARPDDGWTCLRRAVDFAFLAQVRSHDRFRLSRRTDWSTEDLSRRLHRLRAAVRALVVGTGRSQEDAGRDADLVLGAVDAAVRRCIDGTKRSEAREGRSLWAFVRRALGGGPLAGWTVLVTREEPADGPLTAALEARGARTLRIPLLRTLPPPDEAALRREAGRVADYDWVVFTSARAVRALAGAGALHGGCFRVAAVGEATARECRHREWEPVLVGRGGAADLAAGVAGSCGGLRGKRVLFPLADGAREEGPRAMAEAGADVTTVIAYRTAPRPDAAAELRQALSDGRPDAVTFTSPSAVRAFREECDADGCAGLPVAAIGPTTAAETRRAGFAHTGVAKRRDLDAVADALVELFDPGAC